MMISDRYPEEELRELYKIARESHDSARNRIQGYLDYLEKRNTGGFFQEITPGKQQILSEVCAVIQAELLALEEHCDNLEKLKVLEKKLEEAKKPPRRRL